MKRALVLSLLICISIPAIPKTLPTSWELVRLGENTQFVCKLSLVASSCGIDIVQLKDHYSKVRAKFSLSQSESKDLDNNLASCPLPPHLDKPIDSNICEGAKRADAELMSWDGSSGR